MANAVATVSKQLETVHETLAVSHFCQPPWGCSSPDCNPCKVSAACYYLDIVFLQITRRHLTKKLEELDWKVEEQRETTQLIANGVWNFNLHTLM